MKTWIVAIFLALVALSPVAYVLYNNLPNGFVEQNNFAPIATVNFQPEARLIVLETGAEINVLACSVMDGYRFSLYLEGGKTVVAHLPVATKEEAIPIVVELLNNSRFPSVVLLREAGGYWVVNLYLTHSGERVSMVELLKRKDLLLN